MHHKLHTNHLTTRPDPSPAHQGLYLGRSGDQVEVAVNGVFEAGGSHCEIERLLIVILVGEQAVDQTSLRESPHLRGPDV